MDLAQFASHQLPGPLRRDWMPLGWLPMAHNFYLEGSPFATRPIVGLRENPSCASNAQRCYDDWALDADSLGLASIRMMSLQSVSFRRLRTSMTRWSSESEKCMITLIAVFASLAFS